MMITGLTCGIKISVESLYRKDLSNIENGMYFFNYRIVIENLNTYEVQLKSRYWYIFDSLHPVKEISGDGVVGEQPILVPGQKHVYVSGCDLHSEIGYMRGHYVFERVGVHEQFKVVVPKFSLFALPKLN
ncbi:Co2+/Mg2+ efflux protein ApaG [Crocinitomix catalasitica]|uniref:Co2+/Mg2+ efflux protein ApaG n=1 Tax=Crocinitomix catalasitica TaxID=184607 RepID=UPI001B802257|nr:Co2+/Mg2+ efflux protein ApaG [Crocinitomix catalasitica]